MAGEVILVLLIAIFIIIAIYISKQVEKGRKLRLQKSLVSRGYEVKFQNDLQAYHPQKRINIRIRSKTRSYEETSNVFYQIFANAYIDDIFSFRITKRGILSKIFGSNRGNLQIDDQLRIETSNPHHVQLLFNRNKTYIQVKRIMGVAEYLRVSPATKGAIKIELEVRRKNELVLTSIKFIEMLVEIMREISYKEYEFLKEDKYKCFKCESTILYEGDYCQQCGAIAPKCVICFEDPEPNEKLILFNCCKSYAHKEHALIWLENNEICPYCQHKNPRLLKVSETMAL